MMCGNHAGVVRWSGQAKMEGFSITLHLERAYYEEVDEFSLCGFLGVKGQFCGARDDGDVALTVLDSRCATESMTSDSVQHITRS